MISGPEISDETKRWVEYVAKLEAENESLRKQVSQRGARMQIMHKLLNDSVIYAMSLDDRATLESWFDKDGIPL